MKRALAVLALMVGGLTLAASLPPLKFSDLPAGARTLSDGRIVIPPSAGGDVTVILQGPPGTVLAALPALPLDPLPAGTRRLTDGRYVLSQYAGSDVTVIVLSPHPLRVASAPQSGVASDLAFVGRAQASPTPPRTFAPLPPPAGEVGPARRDPAFSVKVDAPRLPTPSFAPLPGVVRETPTPRAAAELGALPPDLKGNFVPRLVNGDLQVTYSLVNTSRATVYRLAVADLSLEQGGRPAAGRLERRDSSAEAGLVPPDSGEYGTVTVTTLDAAPVTLTWLVTDETHQVSYPLRLMWWPGDPRGEARDAE